MEECTCVTCNGKILVSLANRTLSVSLSFSFLLVLFNQDGERGGEAHLHVASRLCYTL